MWVVGTGAVPGGFGIWRWGGSNWSQVEGGGVRIAVGPDGNSWVVNSEGSIWRYDGRQFNKLPGGATDIGVGADGSVWVVGTGAVPGGFGIWRWGGADWMGQAAPPVFLSAVMDYLGS